MKIKTITNVMKDSFIDNVIMPELIAVSPGGFIGWPIVKTFVRALISKVFDPVFQEARRFIEFNEIEMKVEDQRKEFEQAKIEVEKIEASGKVDMADQKTKEAYALLKEKSRNLIRFNNPNK